MKKKTKTRKPKDKKQYCIKEIGKLFDRERINPGEAMEVLSRIALAVGIVHYTREHE